MSVPTKWLSDKLPPLCLPAVLQACAMCLVSEQLVPVAFIGRVEGDMPRVGVLLAVAGFSHPGHKSAFAQEVRRLAIEKHAIEVAMVLEAWTLDLTPQQSHDCLAKGELPRPSTSPNRIEVLSISAERYDSRGKVVTDSVTLLIERVDGKKVALLPHRHHCECVGSKGTVEGIMAHILVPREAAIS